MLIPSTWVEEQEATRSGKEGLLSSEPDPVSDPIVCRCSSEYQYPDFLKNCKLKNVDKNKKNFYYNVVIKKENGNDT